jgi:Transposase DDE domain
MHASRALHTCLSNALEGLHQRRAEALLGCVDALSAGRRLTLTDLARSWPGADRIAAPLKRVDRLLSNPQLQIEAKSLYTAMAGILLRGLPQPVIVVDWSELNRRKHAVLRAALAWQGRTLTVAEIVTPYRKMNSPGIESRLLELLSQMIPAETHPILVTDAGFGPPWFLKVAAMGWHFVGRIRSSKMQVKSVGAPWRSCRSLYATTAKRTCDLSDFLLARKHKMLVRLVVHRKRRQGRVHRNLRGERARDNKSRQVAARESEPWLLAVSPQLDHHAAQIVTLYAKRMQIEQSFRDLKSHRFGMAFEDSLTRKSERLSILLLILALVSFAAWACACVATSAEWLRAQQRLVRQTSRRATSWFRIGVALLLEPTWHPPQTFSFDHPSEGNFA